ncbi:MAG: Hsp20/alpha crystallin family protein [Phycisphaerales bacterium]|nr:Hsp20/alpha crystallin family protein [Phycisphaerales bacterium]
MNLTLWKNRHPLTPNGGPLARLREEMDRSFGRLLGEPFELLEPTFLRTEGWVPPLDISENESEVTIRAEAPGILPKDLDISVTGTILTIAGKKEETKESTEDDFYQCERRFGTFRRVLDLPTTVDAEKVTAEADNGVVTIRVAKKPGTRSKHIEVKSAGKRVPVTT